MKTCFLIAERSYILCKDIASECNENLFSNCRAQLYSMQSYTIYCGKPKKVNDKFQYSR